MRRGRIGIGFGFAGASGDQAETTAWVAAVVGDGGTVSAGRKTLVNDLIVGLKSDGVWTKLDRLWLFAAENSQSALRDIKAAAAATPTNSPAFTADDGYDDSGTSTDKSLNSNFNPTTAPSPNYTQNSFSVFGWAMVDTYNEGALFRYGSDTLVQPNYNFHGTTYWRGGGSVDNAAITSNTGFWSVDRSGAAALKLFRNGAEVDSSTETSAALANTTIKFIGQNIFDSLYYGGTISCGGFGGHLTDAEQADLYDRLRTYLLQIATGFDTYATWNPSDKGSNITLSGVDLIATHSSDADWDSLRATAGKSSGKWYWEIKQTGRVGNQDIMVGAASATTALTTGQHIGSLTDAAGIQSGAGTFVNGDTSDFVGNAGDGALNDVWGIALDMDNGRLYVHQNGTYINSGDPAAGTGFIAHGLSGTYYPVASMRFNTVAVTANFGAAAFVHSVPVGFNSGVTA